MVERGAKLFCLLVWWWEVIQQHQQSWGKKKKLSCSFIYVSDLENYRLNYLNVPLLLNYWAFIVRTVIIQ